MNNMYNHTSPVMKNEGFARHTYAPWLVRNVIAASQDKQAPMPGNPPTPETESLLDAEGLFEIAEFIRRLKEEGRLKRADEEYNDRS